VRRIAHLIDQLPAAQPQVIYGCVEFPGDAQVEVRMVFKAGVGGPPLAEASERMPPDECESMRLKVTGDPRTFSLDGGPGVIALLHR
jgi:hypothetical protein